MSYVVGGCSTYSKSAWLDVPGYPQRLEGAWLAYVRDESKRDYLDFTAALGAVLLGYGQTTQTVSSPSLPLPHASEEAAARLFYEITGWDQVRWCKNGSDATEAALRVARWETGRKVVLTNSYHGSHSDLVTATPGKDGGVLWGVMKRVKVMETPSELLKALQLWGNEVACVMLEPLTPGCQDWRLAEVREACTRVGALLVFDEIITGFRVRLGSAAPEVRPDLACYGKAIGNGWPIACLAGPRALMQALEKDVFMSGTYAAEVGSLIACREVLETLRSEHPYEKLQAHGELLKDALGELVQGYPQRWTLKLPEEHHKRFLRQLVRKGILVGRDFFQMVAHTRRDIERACEAITEARWECGL